MLNIAHSTINQTKVFMNRLLQISLFISTCMLLTACHSDRNHNSEDTVLIKKTITPIKKTAIRSYIFGHSLIKHDGEPRHAQDLTSVPYWMTLLANADSVDYGLSGKFGFLPSYIDGVSPQWGFHSSKVDLIWNDGDGQNFSDVDFNQILFTPANFIQHQSPSKNYYNLYTSPIEATLKLIDWVYEREPSAVITIYENWPEMGEPFPPTSSTMAAYHKRTTGNFHRWYLNYHDDILEARPNSHVRMVPVGPIIAKLLTETELSNIPYDALYEDAEPHGRPTLYFLAAMITYSASYGTQAPDNFSPDEPIHPLIKQHYKMIADFIWQELITFTDKSGNSRIW